MENITIAGSGCIGGGEYGKVSLSGAAKLLGDVRCESFSASGSARAQGSIDCAGKLSASGAFRCDGDVKAGELRASGSTKIEGALTADDASVSGSFSAARVHAGKLQVSGALGCGGDVEAESAELSGKIEIAGLLNAETVTLSPADGSSIGSIGGASVTVRGGEAESLGARILAEVFGIQSDGGRSGLRVGTVEGDEIDLAATTADVVRGRSVMLRSGASAARVEYTETLTVEEGASVGESVKVE